MQREEGCGVETEEPCERLWTGASMAQALFLS